jgi:hypothetical protein
MKYPLKWRHWFLRQTACYFAGHKWKWSPTRKTQYYEMAQEDVPYDYRVGEGRGNYMWEHIAKWDRKCKRCRKEQRDMWPSDVWYKNIWHGMRGWWLMVKWTLKDFFDPKERTWVTIPRWYQYVLLPLDLFCELIEQIGMQFDGPSSWWTWAADIQYWCYEQYDKNSRKVLE